MISLSQRPLPDNTEHSQQTNIHAPGGFRTHDLSKRAAADLCLRSRGYWDRQWCLLDDDDNHMFRPIPAIIRFTSERVLVFIRFMQLCKEGEISSSVVLIITTIKRHGCGGRSVMWVLCWLGVQCSRRCLFSLYQGHEPGVGVHEFPNNVGTIIKFWMPERRHGEGPLLRTYKY